MAKQFAGQGIVVVGGQWGDEGKGRIVDTIAEVCDVVVRFQGGNNAGHTLHIGERSVVLHLVPCGIMRPDTVCMIGNGVVIDPEVLMEEIDMLRRQGVVVTGSNLRIASNAHIIFPFHKARDASRESVGKLHLGTTKRGIGPCYEDKVGRFGIIANDLSSPSTIKAKLEKIAELGYTDVAGAGDALVSWARAMADHLAPFLCDVGEELEAHLKNNRRVLFEGAQGALLDVDHGTYPFVTSSNCVAAQASIGTGVGSKWLSEILVVTKAYCTRVGEGPFFSESDHQEQEVFRKLGNEFGATTGRPRRCGWLDLPALKYAARINGATGLVLTKVDILAGLDALKVGVAYRLNNDRVTTNFLDVMAAFHRGETIALDYKDFTKVTALPDHVRAITDLPRGIRELCDYVEKFIELPVRIISYGSRRGQELYL